MDAARAWLLARQNPEGWWRGELDGDVTLESYFILLHAFLGELEHPDLPRLARVIRREVLPDGGWGLYPGGPADVSVSCLAYFALKVAGVDPEDADMRRSRDVARALGGIDRANSYTRYFFALFGQVPWSQVPAIPPELILLPSWAPVSIWDMSSWSRTIFVPLSIVYAKKPVRELPARCQVPELVADPRPPRPAPASSWQSFFLATDLALKAMEVIPAPWVRRAAVRRALRWMTTRLQDSDGLGAILPAMVNSVLALVCGGYGPAHPLVIDALAHLDGLVLRDPADDTVRVQPCLSPVWDTCLAVHALAQSGVSPDHPSLQRAASWLLTRQTRRRGDWAVRNRAEPGGWYFERRNEFYPDVDDTCMALLALGEGHVPGAIDQQRAAIDRGLRWMLSMQNRDGGWASFDRDNDKRFLTQVPFADHNAMIDPSTADITGRVLECLATFPGFDLSHDVVRRAVQFLKDDQGVDGSWFGRWGVNHIYGTWQALRGLRCIGQPMDAPFVRHAAAWLERHQNPDGGWGESIASYDDPTQKGHGPSTPSQTAWAVMGLTAAGFAAAPSVRRGLSYLVATQTPEGTWEQASWTGTGFPRVFYLDYQHYRHYFPLMALAQNSPRTPNEGRIGNV